MPKYLLPFLLLGSTACTIGGVKDSETGDPIAGATVTYEHIGTDGVLIDSWTTTTDGAGVYSFNPYGGGGTVVTDLGLMLPENETFRIIVRAPGYRNAVFFRFLGEYTNISPAGQQYRDEEIFDLVPNNAPDADGDGLSTSWEAALGTSDNDPDSDGDGLSDWEETHGAFMLDVRHWIDNVAADPAVHDVYLKLFARPDALDDSMNSGATAAAINTFMSNFGAAVAAAPPIERNGTTYPRRLHVAKEMHSTITEVVDFWMTEGSSGATVSCNAANSCHFLGVAGAFNGMDYDRVKADVFPQRVTGQSAEWRIARIGIITKQYIDWENKELSGSSGRAELLGNDFIVTLSQATFGSSATRRNLRSTIWHELGHTFGLLHQTNNEGGSLNAGNSKVHQSVMSYRYQTSGGSGEGPAGLPSGVPAWSLGGGNGNLRCPCASGYTCRTVGHSSVQRCVKNGLVSRAVDSVLGTSSTQHRARGGQFTFEAWCKKTTKYRSSDKTRFWAGGTCSLDADCTLNRPNGTASVNGTCDGECRYTVAALGTVRSWTSSDQDAADLIESVASNIVTRYDFRRADCDVDEWHHAGLWNDLSQWSNGVANLNATNGDQLDAVHKSSRRAHRVMREASFDVREAYTRHLKNRVIGPDYRIVAH